MSAANQHRRIARKCAAALEQAIDRLPDLLNESEPEQAAAIVADLIKACLARPMPEEEPGAELRRIVAFARRQTERRHQEEAERAPSPIPNS